MKIRIYDAGRHTETQTGYGQMAKNFFDNLKARGLDVDWFSDQEEMNHDTVYLWMRPPHYIKYDQFKEEYCNVFFTMHELETFDDWKRDWPDLLNKCQAIITPSEWNKEVFMKNGVTKPIKVVSLGVDTKVFCDRYRNFSLLAVHENLGGDSSRERWQQTVTAYIQAFMDKKDVRLTIKTWNWKPDSWREWLDRFDATRMPKIDVLDLKMEPLTMAELYRTHHVFIKNSNGEGWSMPVSEAYACGCFIIANNLPILQERLKEGREALFFGNPEDLRQAILDKHRDWKKIQGKKEAYSWKNVTSQLAFELNEIYEGYKKLQ